MGAGTDRNPANWGLGAIGVSGYDHHTIVSEHLPSLEGPGPRLDLLDRHAGLDAVAQILPRWQVCLYNLETCDAK